jgi:hypothetical protein
MIVNDWVERFVKMRKMVIWKGKEDRDCERSLCFLYDNEILKTKDEND